MKFSGKGLKIRVGLFLVSLMIAIPLVADDFLWAFDGPGGSGYLMGSIHLLKAEYYPLSDTIEKAFAHSSTLVVEADISPQKMGEAALLQMNRGMYAQDDELRNHISAETYAMVGAKLKKLGMGIESFKRFKPWMLAMTIISMEMMRMGFDPRYGVDRYFLEKAQKKMEVRELEGLEKQIDLFDGFSDSLNDRFLFYNIQESERSRQQVDEMVAAWFKGDALRMQQLVTESVERFPDLAELYRVIIYDRNQSMVESILAMLESDKRVFVVVGAAHLVGEKGIISLMKKRGFSLRQL